MNEYKKKNLARFFSYLIIFPKIDGSNSIWFTSTASGSSKSQVYSNASPDWASDLIDSNTVCVAGATFGAAFGVAIVVGVSTVACDVVVLTIGVMSCLIMFSWFSFAV